MAKILVIEDEVNVTAFLKKGLEENGHTIDVAYDGVMGLHLASTSEYDLMILDIILPQMNGLDVCKKYRENRGFSVPIIMLTALGTTEDIVKGLQTGADDYLVKPFKFVELSARIDVILRRKNSKDYIRIYKFADLTLDMETKNVTRAGKNITLTLKEFRLLEYLLSHKERIISRTSILENVWDTNTDYNTNVVEVYINYLRNKVDKGFSEKLIHTVVGMGYVLKTQ
jgi:DNA-binding response OmpR family regulator